MHAGLRWHNTRVVSHSQGPLFLLAAHWWRRPSGDEGDALGDQLLQVMLDHLLALEVKACIRESNAT